MVWCCALTVNTHSKGCAMLPISPSTPWLAPLAGWSDLPFRLLCREQGAAVCCTEMVSAKGLVYGGKNTEALLDTLRKGDARAGEEDVPDEPLVVQVFGAEAEFMERAVLLLRERGFSFFDVNMGCSVPKVTKTGAGAAMLRDVPNALRVAEAVIRAAGEGRVGFKLRLGWDASREVYLSLARELEARGAGWITLHPRHAVQGFSGAPRHSALREMAGLLNIPVIASGDLFTAEDSVRVLRETGVSCVMYARGALKDPRVFADHRRLLEGRPAQPADLIGIMRRHICLARKFSPQDSFLKMRTFLPRYMKGMDGAKALRQEIVSCRGWDDLESVLAHFNGHMGAPCEHPAPSMPHAAEPGSHDGHMDAPSEHLSPDTPCAAASGSHDGNIKTGDPHAGQD